MTTEFKKWIPNEIADAPRDENSKAIFQEMARAAHRRFLKRKEQSTVYTDA